MKLVVFGLTISSTWGNGHATLWRGLVKGLAAQGVETTFFERDVRYYAETRDLTDLGGGALVLYPEWRSVRAQAEDCVRNSDVVIVTSYCPDAVPASRLAWEARDGLSVFYDMDTPVTLARRHRAESVPYIPDEGLSKFDLVLSYTGGPALEALRSTFGARRTVPLYGHADPDTHRLTSPASAYEGDVSYIGTFAEDRQAAVERLFLAPARQRPGSRFVLAGAMYPADFPWQPNIKFVRHLPPQLHPSFYASSRLTLNITRQDMRRMGWCPSGRLFEAMACGAIVLSDDWPGLRDFFEPGRHLAVVATTEDILTALDQPNADWACMRQAARDHVLAHHTSAHRARELVSIVREIRHDAPQTPAEV